MGDAKKIVLRPIDSKIANQFIERVHYSGKLVNNSILLAILIVALLLKVLFLHS